MIKNLRFIKKIIFFFLITECVYAEYRVYQYWVKSKSRDKAELITSSLDPKAYLAYYGKENETSINLVRSWVCYGDTGKHKVPCNFEEKLNNEVK